MKKLTLLILLSLTVCIGTRAQTRDIPFNITLIGGLSEYSGDWGNGFYNLDFKNIDNNRAFGGSVTRYLNRSFDLSVMGTYGTVSFFYHDQSRFKTYLTQTNVNLRYKFGLSDDATFKPFVFLGTGALNFDGTKTVRGLEWMPFTAGAGLNVRLNDFINLQYQVTYGYWGSDNRDLLAGGQSNDAHLFNTVGIGFNLGTKKDEDNDGVSDKNDKCPGTPVGVNVDKMGCPLDIDKDGVADYLDKCPNDFGLASTNGCPDKDKDGVADLEDQCPDVAGTVELKGCPDTDGDGIIDSKDACPNEKGSLAANGCPDRDGDGVIDKDDICPDAAGLPLFKGCPDTDGDGIEDSKDMCPDKKGPAAANGCPDTDNDGVADNLDKCPDVAGSPTHQGCPDTDNDGVFDDIDKCRTIPGTAANEGCPEIKKEIKQLFQKALQGIQFETGKAVIKPVSFPILDAVVNVMNQNPTYKLLIGGHTDDVGSDQLNMTLSQNRAESVAKYLISKGVSPMRVAATGYGETQPVDTNKSAAGRARNRRVELKVEFIETVPVK